MSERSLSAALATAVTDLVVYPVLFLEGEFSTGWGRWWSGVGPFSWDGETWVGLGGLLSVSPISETTDTKAQGFSIDLSGQDPANIAIALSACRQGKVGRIWLGALTAAGVLVGDPYLLRQGKLDVAGCEGDDGQTAVIRVSYEDELIDLERAREYRWTTESQRLFYPDDLGFEFVPGLQDSVDIWYAGP
jgi:hypothetical protein